MKTIHNYTLRAESWESQRANHRYNPATLLIHKYKGKRYALVIDAGQTDTVCVFKEKALLYVLSLNTRYGYVGLEVFNLSHWQACPYEKGLFTAPSITSLFLQNSQDIYDCLGKQGLGLAPMSMAKRLGNSCLCMA